MKYTNQGGGKNGKKHVRLKIRKTGKDSQLVPQRVNFHYMWEMVRKVLTF